MNKIHDYRNKEILIINTKTDLLKISIDKISNFKLENFSGIYFNKLYDEAIKSESLLETEESSPVKKIKKEKKAIKKENKKRIAQNVNYIVIPPKNPVNENKQSFYVINKIIFSIKYNSLFGEEVLVLGSISKLGFWDLRRGLPLKWNEGNIWIGEISLDKNDLKNFEFKFVVVEKGNIKFWESGTNNIINFEELINKMKNNKVGRYNKYNYEYNENNKSLFIKCSWY